MDDKNRTIAILLERGAAQSEYPYAFLVNEFQCNIMLREDDYFEITGTLCTLFQISTGLFAFNLFEAWKESGYPKMQKPLQSIFNALVTDMNRISGSGNDQTISRYLKYWAPICNELIGADYEANARKLMRNLGKFCSSMEQYGRMTREMPEKMHQKVIDSFAEGAIGIAGPAKIGMFYVNNFGKGLALKKTDRSKRDPEVIKAEISSVCYNTDNPQILAQRIALVQELGQVIGTVEAQTWFEETFPHLVGS